MRHKREMINVTVFTVVMLLVAAGLVVVFGQFRFASSNTYHANFTDASRRGDQASSRRGSIRS